MTNTIATPITDKNGRATTVYKNPDKGSQVNLSRASGARVSSSCNRASISSGLVLEPSEGAPFPQANDLGQIASVVDYVDSGATTPDALAICLGSNAKSSRAGSYYGDAAAYLGLIEKVSSGAADDNFSEYVLTDSGREFLALDSDSREDVLGDSVDDMELVQIYREHGEDELKKYIEMDYGYAESTIERRAACIKSWSDQANDGSLSGSIASNVQDGTSRSDEARALVARQRREAREAAQSARSQPAEVCTECFLEKSSSGQCDC